MVLLCCEISIRRSEEKGFEYFQKFMKENGILDRLEELGIEEGDTVQLYNLAFDYYK